MAVITPPFLLAAKGHLKAAAVLATTMACYGLAQADGLSALDQHLKTMRSGTASFTQTVSNANKPGAVKTSSGQFAFNRPQQFRFDYTKPFAQTIVADGQTLWLHDVDLNQVTARPQSQVLGSTPAALIAAAPDLRALQADFALQAAPDKDGLQWVNATPKSKDGQLQSVRIGFKPADKGDELAVLEILDSFGQRSVLSFSGFQVNPSLPADSFQFKPPAGADVLRQ